MISLLDIESAASGSRVWFADETPREARKETAAMKTGSIWMRLFVGAPVVVGLCLMQGCSTTESGKGQGAPAVTTVQPESVATNKAKVEPMPAVPEKEKAVLKPVPPMTTPYTVKAGESVTEVAAKFGKRWQDVLAVNPDLKKDS